MLEKALERSKEWGHFWVTEGMNDHTDVTTESTWGLGQHRQNEARASSLCENGIQPMVRLGS